MTIIECTEHLFSFKSPLSTGIHIIRTAAPFTLKLHFDSTAVRTDSCSAASVEAAPTLPEMKGHVSGPFTEHRQIGIQLLALQFSEATTLQTRDAVPDLKVILNERTDVTRERPAKANITTVSIITVITLSLLLLVLLFLQLGCVFFFFFLCCRFFPLCSSICF